MTSPIPPPSSTAITPVIRGPLQEGMPDDILSLIFSYLPHGLWALACRKWHGLRTDTFCLQLTDLFNHSLNAFMQKALGNLTRLSVPHAPREPSPLRELPVEAIEETPPHNLTPLLPSPVPTDTPETKWPFVESMDKETFKTLSTITRRPEEVVYEDIVPDLISPDKIERELLDVALALIYLYAPTADEPTQAIASLEQRQKLAALRPDLPPFTQARPPIEGAANKACHRLCYLDALLPQSRNECAPRAGLATSEATPFKGLFAHLTRLLVEKGLYQERARLQEVWQRLITTHANAESMCPACACVLQRPENLSWLMKATIMTHDPRTFSALRPSMPRVSLSADECDRLTPDIRQTFSLMLQQLDEQQDPQRAWTEIVDYVNTLTRGEDLLVWMLIDQGLWEGFMSHIATHPWFYCDDDTYQRIMRAILLQCPLERLSYVIESILEQLKNARNPAGRFTFLTPLFRIALQRAQGTDPIIRGLLAQVEKEPTDWKLVQDYLSVLRCAPNERAQNVLSSENAQYVAQLANKGLALKWIRNTLSESSSSPFSRHLTKQLISQCRDADLDAILSHIVDTAPPLIKKDLIQEAAARGAKASIATQTQIITRLLDAALQQKCDSAGLFLHPILKILHWSAAQLYDFAALCRPAAKSMIFNYLSNQAFSALPNQDRRLLSTLPPMTVTNTATAAGELTIDLQDSGTTVVRKLYGWYRAIA